MKADPERLAETLRKVADGTLLFRISDGHARTVSDGLLRHAAFVADRVAKQDAEITALRAENADLKQAVITFAAPWAAQWAESQGLPRWHLYPEHYDLLAKCGGRMDDFTRAEIGETGVNE